MYIVDQSVELMKHDIEPYQFIEKAARTCYKSEDKITEDSAKKMVTNLVKSNHLAMLEHEYVYFFMDNDTATLFEADELAERLKYINVGLNYVSGSLRAFKEFLDRTAGPIQHVMKSMLIEKYPEVFGTNNIVLDETDKSFAPYISLVTREVLCNDEKEDYKTNLIPHTFKFITNRGISHELVRHRVASVAQESQRYVDYSKDKYTNQITVIRPHIHETDILNYENWHYAMLMAETQYMNLRKGGIRPEIARGVLPNDCKTEIIITATEEEWQHIIDLRYHGTTGTPHPQMKELMTMVYPILKEESNGRIH